MLPQTNLQLYSVLLERGADEQSLALVRAGYDVARKLFAGAFRPGHKPFLCHLIGTASALAGWGEPVEVVVAGLLHSAYLFGGFGDGERGASSARRHWLRRVVGADAEKLVCAYTEARWDQPIDALIVAARRDAVARRLTTVKLADLLDDISDGGLLYAPQKRLEFKLHEGAAPQREFLRLVDACVGSKAVQQFDTAFAGLAQIAPPACLRTADQSFHIQAMGVPELARSRLRRKLARLRRHVFQTRAA